MIGKLERVPLREVWKHEATDFTRWLEENIDVLGEALDLNLSSAVREQTTGSFSVDLVAENQGGDLVVIECQLEKSDHDHLGKLVTYLSAIGAKTAIWIVADAKPEHALAISWLNGSSAADFYLVKVEAVRIEESPPAPLLTKIVGPSEDMRAVEKTKEGLAAREALFLAFWEQLLRKANARTKLHTSVSPGRDYWIGTSAGRSGLGLNYAVRQHDAGVELYIYRGKGTKEENKAIFDSLARSKEDIDSAFGEPLDWQRLNARDACRIEKRLEVGGYLDKDKWPQIRDAMIDAMIRLEKALRPHIDRLRV